jgi:hypothetical protein
MNSIGIPRSMNETVFTEAYEWSASKIVEILLSIFNIVLVTPWFIYNIWYKRYGANHRKTLINQFTVSMFYYAAFYNLFGQPLEVIILAFGPFPIQLCYFRKFVRGVMQCDQIGQNFDVWLLFCLSNIYMFS